MKMLRRGMAVYGLTIAGVFSLDAAEIRYRMMNLRHVPPPPGQKNYSTYAAAISDTGYIAGSIGDGDDGRYPFRATVDGEAILVDRPAGAWTAWGLGVNDDGMLVGGCVNSGFEAALRWTETDGLEVLAEIPNALAMNNLGQILTQDGIWSDATGLVPFGVPGARGSAINNHSEATGILIGAGARGAWIWDPVRGLRILGELPGGGRAAYGTGINDLGQIVGLAATPGGARPFIWSESAGFTLLPVAPGWTGGQATDINGAGQVVGYCDRLPAGPVRPTLWDPQRGLILLDEVMDPCGRRPLGLQARAINNAGVILVDRGTNTESYVLMPYLRGDLDDDEDCDGQDLAMLLSNFGRRGDAVPEHGDVDCD